ncbi:hypothetical protein ACFOWE_06250 [Planomonospora corallina]|uniref:Uncharacterized protein n=1 Tax=Planomonospora corallina TaxID=1806052 RepID=A0ABV8I3U4_9ACTN
MTMLDVLLPVLTMANGFWQSPFFLVLLALAAGLMGAKAVERIPFTRRIIERREAENG